MAVFAVVPVKRLGVSKKRLSSVLIPHDRKALTVAMLLDVLTSLKNSQVAKTVLVTNDLALSRVAEKFGLHFLLGDKPGLNPAIEQATQWCLANHADSVLILPADIPLITPKDIDNIIALGKGKHAVVLSPSPNGGTNALLKKPPNIISACFGAESFNKHYYQALKAKAKVTVFCSEGTGMDIDSVEDLERFCRRRNKTLSFRLMKKIKPLLEAKLDCESAENSLSCLRLPVRQKPK